MAEGVATKGLMQDVLIMLAISGCFAAITEMLFCKGVAGLMMIMPLARGLSSPKLLWQGLIGIR
jgi:hypothetical protein